MQAFVTGSTGLLGSNLVRELVDQGYRVKALVRNLEKAKDLLGDLPQVQVIVGDLQNIPAFAAELQGCDVLFHTAAYFRESYGLGNHWPLLQRLNIDATLELLEAAATAGVRKTIYVSSSGCIGLNPDGSPGNETTPPGPITYKNLYFKSKLMAEAAVCSRPQAGYAGFWDAGFGHYLHLGGAHHGAEARNPPGGGEHYAGEAGL